MINVNVFISEKNIRQRVKALAMKISKDFKKEEVVFVGVLKGSFIFVSDLIRKLKIPVTIDFVCASSYEGKSSTGKITITKDVTLDLKDKVVVLVEDIVDTGLTVKVLMEHLKKRGAKKVAVCALLSKPSARKVKVPLEYCGFEIKNEFVIGYGLDLNQDFRQLPFVGRMVQKN